MQYKVVDCEGWKIAEFRNHRDAEMFVRFYYLANGENLEVKDWTDD